MFLINLILLWPLVLILAIVAVITIVMFRLLDLIEEVSIQKHKIVNRLK